MTAGEPSLELGRAALIGFTGFVGGTLQRRIAFEGLYNSKNIATIHGQSFDTIVCAGAPAEKWRANQDPAADAASLARLRDGLSGVSARHVILISTVDVYPVPVGVDEDTVIVPDPKAHYGRHRLELEECVATSFDATIVRLPGLFGRGLKKNIVFDLLNGNQVDRVDSEAVFQFYDMACVVDDIARVRALRLPLVNFATEPTSVAEVAEAAFGRRFDNRLPATPPRYDVRSRHANALGGGSGYLYDKRWVLERMRAFVAEASASAPR